MTELLAQIESVLGQAAGGPERAIGSFWLLTEEARGLLPRPERALGVTWRGAFHEQFAAQARRLPDKTAVAAADGRWSYVDLDAETNRLPHRLLAGGIAKGDPLAIPAPPAPPLSAPV